MVPLASRLLQFSIEQLADREQRIQRTHWIVTNGEISTVTFLGHPGVNGMSNAIDFDIQKGLTPISHLTNDLALLT